MGIGAGRPFGSESLRLDEDRRPLIVFSGVRQPTDEQKTEKVYSSRRERFPTPGATKILLPICAFFVATNRIRTSVALMSKKQKFKKNKFDKILMISYRLRQKTLLNSAMRVLSAEFV